MPDSKITPVFTITFKVIAYDCAGYGSDCTREFSSSEEAIKYARGLDERFAPHVVKIIAMQPIYQDINYVELKNGIA